LWPWCFIAGDQEIADLRLDPLYTLPRRAGAQIPMAVLPVVVRAERVTKEVKAFLAGILQRGLHLVERQPEFRHRRLRPRQRLGRVAAAEDDEVVGIGDDPRAERLGASGDAPVLEEPIHVDDGEQRARVPALRRAARAALAT